MEKVPRFSIITPVYNGEEYLKGCYEDIIGFNCRDWEWIIVDDGSKDSTLQVGESLARQDSRVRIFSYQKNKGRGHARNRAIAEARGEWVVILDADDHALPSRLDYLAGLKNPQFDWFNCPVILTKRRSLEVYGCREVIKNELNKMRRKAIHPSLIMRTEVARELGYREFSTVGGIGEDIYLILSLSLKYRGYFHDEASVLYCEDAEVNLRKALHSNWILFRMYLEVIPANLALIKPVDAGRALIAQIAKLGVLGGLYWMPFRDRLYRKTISSRAASVLNSEVKEKAERFLLSRKLKNPVVVGNHAG